MPTPTRTGRDRIVRTGLELLEEGGPDAVTMSAVAVREGVRAPSLYKHVRDRRDLLTLVVAAVTEDLAERMRAARDAGDPRRSIVLQLEAVRRFAAERPHGWGLVFGTSPGTPRPTRDALELAVQPLLEATSALLGPDRALDGARFITAWANGFITMELTGVLRLGGDVPGAWEWGLRHAVAALTGPDRETSSRTI